MRRRKLTSQLGVEVSKWSNRQDLWAADACLHQLQQAHILQAHTILKSVVHKYENKPVLVLGGRNDDVRKVAEGSGASSLDVHGIFMLTTDVH